MQDQAPTRALRGRAFLAGAVTGLAGIGTSELVRAALHRETGPVVAVAESVRDATPGALAVPLVHLVRHLDKPLLITGTLVAFLALSGLAGVLHARRPWLGYLIMTALGAVALVAILGRDGSSQYDVIPLVVGYLTWLLVLPWLTRSALAVADAPEVSDGPASPGRRQFLLQVAGTGAGAIAGVGLSRLLGAGRAKVEQARQALNLKIGRGTVPAGNTHDPVEPWRTASSRFYQIDTALAIPEIEPADWRLRIHGMVDHPFTIGYDELVALGLTERWITLCCVSNDVGGNLISNAYWSGVPIRTLLQRAGVQAGADAVKQTSKDGWTCGTPVSALTDPKREAMLAIAMNGAPLPLEHGFPVRMVVPGLYGYVSATKWLVDLEVTRFTDFSAYWTQRGWGPKGPVKTESRIDVPEGGGAIGKGSGRLVGYAWAQHTGIEKVEVRIDDGAWLRATLGPVPNDDTWVQWWVSADVPAGKHVAAVRATDKSGYTQTSQRADVLPDGATGWHTVQFEAS